jgi:beta-lactamase regulating signal transducer with metallopeptidase domain
MIPVGGSALLTPADSARAVSTVYAASLLAMVPVALAAIATVSLRRATAESRMLVWRSAVITMLAVYVGRFFSLHAIALAIPSALATPLIALGRVQVTSAALPPLRSNASSFAASGFVQLLLLVYVAGALAVLLPTIMATLRVRRMVARARVLDNRQWSTLLNDVRYTLGVRRVRLLVSDDALVPMTFGFLRPIVVLPRSIEEWDDSRRRMVLMHELAHVRAADWVFSIAARLSCAIYWFHPAAWWIARRMHEDCELACDDRVIVSGARRSDYAELLADAADRLRLGGLSRVSALALSERGGLRVRLSAVLDTRRDVRPIARRWVAVAAIATLIVAAPTGSVQLAPTRDTLTSLMLDARWESRAYAVLGLAQRPDSIAVARSAAVRDPNPRVRAWARYALGERAADPIELRAIVR